MISKMVHDRIKIGFRQWTYTRNILAAAIGKTREKIGIAKLIETPR